MFGELPRYVYVWHFKGLSSLVKAYCVEKVNVSARERAKFLSIRGGLPGLSFNAHIYPDNSQKTDTVTSYGLLR